MEKHNLQSKDDIMLLLVATSPTKIKFTATFFKAYAIYKRCRALSLSIRQWDERLNTLDRLFQNTSQEFALFDLMGSTKFTTISSNPSGMLEFDCKKWRQS